ncbi:MAG TPA: hypothetical protein VHS96_06565 [Bacteroidia bacterium]|nr:hypothetical protein [Bacteroidia bacterium]
MKEEKDQFEDFLHEMMQEGGLEQAPSGFTQRVMGEIAAPQAVKARPRWQPVISWRGWVGAAAGVVIAFLVGYFIPWSGPSKPLPGQAAVDQAIDTAVGTFGGIRPPMLLVIALGAMFLLFALDRMLSRRTS